ncbi:MAG: anthranilate synthase component I, partial [Gammaproteobacteria bacterium]
MTPEAFAELKQQQYTHIPLAREVLADLDTPLSTYLKLANTPYSYLFESVHGGEKWGRYSIIGLPCSTRIKIFGQRIDIEKDNCSTESIVVADPLQWIEDYQQQFKVADVPGLPRFTGGLVGYFGYDTIRYIEPRLGENTRPDQLQTPDILLMLSEEVVVFDNLRGKLYLIVQVNPQQDNAYETGQQRLSQLEKQLRETVPGYQPTAKSRKVEESDFVSGFTEDGFKQAVRKAREYIIDGDIMQVVLSQRLSIPFNAPPLDLYRSLRSLNPSPYMFYLNLDDHYVVGSSPEILVRLENNIITVRPIAGTRPRGKTEADDIALEKDLLADPKELAEHLMLIDLGRNDTGRVSKVGSVKLTDKMIIERYSHVMHIVSNVTGELNDGMSAMDVLRATFPAGTVSGAPKIRAMEI